MTIVSSETTAPAHWASALVNDDYSGLDELQALACRAWQAEIAPWYVVDVVRDESGEAQEQRFTWHFAVHAGREYGKLFPDVRGGNVLDYVIHCEQR